LGVCLAVYNAVRDGLRMLKVPGWRGGPADPWWGPYLGVLVLAGIVLLAVLVFALFNAAEIIRVIRTSTL
jgi:hypothetical protein